MTEQLDAPKTKQRRWLRITLRGVLLLLAVLACAFGWLASQVHRARQEQSIVSQLTAAHGQSLNIVYANPFDADAKEEMAMFFVGGPEWLTDLLGADIFCATVGLTCYAPGNSFSSAVDENGRFFWRRNYVAGVTADQIEMIARLRHLKRLWLEANPVDDAHIAAIVKLKRLESLNLSHTAITDEALVTLARAPSLRDLNISYTDITDRAVDSLVEYHELERLNIEVTQLSDREVDRLKQRLPDCEIIH